MNQPYFVSMNQSDISETRVSEYDDPRRPLVRAVKFGSIALAIVTVASFVVWGGLRDLAGMYGVMIGAAIGGGFVLLTAVSVLVTTKTSPSTTMAVVLGGWLLKILLLIVVLMFIRDLEFYDTMAMFITVVLALIVVLGTEVWGVITAKVTYVS